MSALEPVLARDLCAAGLLRADAAVAITGPRRWWEGPLNVEGLALGSVGVAAAALGALTGLDVSLNSTRVAASFGSFAALRINGRRPNAFAELSGFFRTADGWIRTHANYPHHADRLLRAIGAAAPGSVARELAELPGLVAEERIVAEGGVAAVVRPRASAAGVPASGSPWLSLIPSGDPTRLPWRARPGAALPLAGLRVLDLTRVVAGPAATRLLAALGAQVLRVDPPELPEEHSLHVDMDFAKRSAVVDLRDRHSQRRLQRVLADADVVVLGYRPDGLRALGLDPETLATEHPNLVVASLSAWTAHGPWAERRGFDSIVQASSGIADRYRRAEGSPGVLPVQALDHGTGFGIAASILALLAARQRGEGCSRVALSLSATADALFELAAPEGVPESPGEPVVNSARGTWGVLRYAPPPLLIDGAALDYPAGPRGYGRDELRWL